MAVKIASGAWYFQSVSTTHQMIALWNLNPYNWKILFQFLQNYDISGMLGKIKLKFGSQAFKRKAFNALHSDADPLKIDQSRAQLEQL